MSTVSLFIFLVLCQNVVALIGCTEQISNQLKDFKVILQKIQFELDTVNEKLDNSLKENTVLRKRINDLTREHIEIKNVIHESGFIQQQQDKNERQYVSGDFKRGRRVRKKRQNYEANDIIANATTVHTVTVPLPKVAFSVALAKTLSLDFIQKITYDKVMMNIGDGYDVNTGTFVVPVNGVYLFYFTALNTAGDKAYIELVQNGVRLGILSIGKSHDNMSSQVVLAYLAAGNNIWVRNASQAGPILRGNVREIYNTFTGVLLYR